MVSTGVTEGTSSFGVLRVMAQIMERLRFRGSGMFDGKRDMHAALGYAEEISSQQMRYRFERGDIAARIIDSYPKATWRNGAEVLDDDTAEITTPFEEAVKWLMMRRHLWNALFRTDLLAQMNDYAIVVIGAPGLLGEEMPKGNGNPEKIAYFSCYGEQNVRIDTYEEDTSNARFGMPTMYHLTGLGVSAAGTAAKDVTVHWSRVVHFADGFLDNPLKGTLRLRQVWNQLDNLVKVVGGGSEAFWKLVFQGLQIDVDKDMDLEPGEKESLQEQMDQYEHNLRRMFRTRGVKVNALGQDVAQFDTQAGTIMDMIAGTAGIPKRILLGSERGELASSQDQDNWNERVGDRQTEVAAPFLVHPLVDRLLEYRYLPPPKGGIYWVRWPMHETLTLKEKSEVMKNLAETNAKMGETVVTGADLRGRVLGWDPLKASEVDDAEDEDDDEDLDDEDDDLEDDEEIGDEDDEEVDDEE